MTKTMHARVTRGPMRTALAQVLGSPGRRAGFVAITLLVALLYSILLPFNYTQRFELANWNYLDAYLIIWAVVLGMGMGLVICVQIFAMRQITANRAGAGTVGGIAFVASLLPSFLCCTPAIPTILTLVGVTGVGLYGTTSALQYFFAVHQNEFLIASLLLIAVTAWWGLRKIARERCFTESACEAVPNYFENALSADSGEGQKGTVR